jgi:hypothetical protein
VSAAATGRFATLSRWLGITLVVLLALQLIAVLAVNGWGEESFSQVLSGTLVSQSPMAFVGMLLMLIGQRLDEPVPGRTPLRWFVCVVSGLLAVALLITVPVTINADRAVSDQANQALLAQRGQLEMARSQFQGPKALEAVIAQGERTGQLPADLPQAKKEEAARAVLETQIKPQLKKAEAELKQAENRRDLAANQRRIGGTGTAVVLLVAFTLLALVAVL